MRRTDKAALQAGLEEKYAQWAALGPENGGRKLDLLGELFALAYELFPGHEDGITTVFMEDWKGFDPSKGSLYGFFASRIRLREKDSYRKDALLRQRVLEDAAVMDGDEGLTLLETLPAAADSDPEGLLRLDAAACELLAAVLELPQRLEGRSGNPVRRNYFRMFFTDNIVTYLHGSPPPEVFRKRQRDLFTALKQDFLDYFMEERCRSAADICSSPLKPYGEIAEGRPMEETRLPLPGDVYTCYLDRVEGTPVKLSALSQQKQFYLKEVRKWLM